MKYLWLTIVLLVITFKLSESLVEERPNFWKLLAQLREGDTENAIKNSQNGVNKSSKSIKNRKSAKLITQFLKTEDFMKFFSTKSKNFLATRSGREGRTCYRDEDCGPGPGHVCIRNTCECNQMYIKHNDSHCLPGVLLGFSCISHHQCRIKVPLSSCIQGYCRCGEGTVPYRRANCLPVSSLGESCRTTEQCSLGTEGSSCKWIVKNVLGKCKCKLGMPRKGDKCESPGFALGAPCGKSYDCSQHVPGSICVSLEETLEENSKKSSALLSSRDSTLNEIIKYSKEEMEKGSLGGICRCPSGYLAIKNGTKCVPLKKAELGRSPISLGKPCTFSSQCKASDPFSFCNEEGVCDCLERSPQCSARNTGCLNETFQCVSNGKCVSPDFVCDGINQCQDGSDEASCSPGACSPLAFTCNDGTCVSRAKICDGRYDCPDKSDEKRCHLNKEGCPSKTFACEDGQCLPEFEFCNAFPSCKDKTDETIQPCIGGMFRVPYCPFRCKNGRCRSLSIVCSGTDGCGDNSDEQICSVCNCPKPQ